MIYSLLSNEGLTPTKNLMCYNNTATTFSTIIMMEKKIQDKLYLAIVLQTYASNYFNKLYLDYIDLLFFMYFKIIERIYRL